jgi:hypothetical protein
MRAVHASDLGATFTVSTSGINRPIAGDVRQHGSAVGPAVSGAPTVMASASTAHRRAPDIAQVQALKLFSQQAAVRALASAD